MKTLFLKFTASTAIAMSIILSGCNMADKSNNKGMSTDVEAFNELISLNLRVHSIKWEIFGTPEYTGGVPGPTDYVTLIAEIRTPDTIIPAHGTTSIWIVTEAARTWLGKPFYKLLEQNRNTALDLAKNPNCKRTDAILKKSKSTVDGFICKDEDSVLLYLQLFSESASVN